MPEHVMYLKFSEQQYWRISDAARDAGMTIEKYIVSLVAPRPPAGQFGPISAMETKQDVGIPELEGAASESADRETSDRRPRRNRSEN